MSSFSLNKSKFITLFDLAQPCLDFCGAPTCATFVGEFVREAFRGVSKAVASEFLQQELQKFHSFPEKFKV